METQDVYSYIKSQENTFATERVPLTNSKDWNMKEHIERCYNVANGWFHSGKNDGKRPYDDLVTPIIDVAFRSEGFDVKDIVPYVNDVENAYKSLFIKKYHPDWATKHQLDTLIDDVVETSIIYDLVLIKNVNNIRPEVIDLKTIAFCDQVDVMNGPICIKHQFTPAELVEMKGKWDDDKIDQAIFLSKYERTVSSANDKGVKTPSKVIEVYELRGNLPEVWLKDSNDLYKYVPQAHYICYYLNENGDRAGLTLFKGKDKPLNENFFALKIDRVRSKGRACGRSIVERLFEPQVWNNHSAIQLKKLLDGAFSVIVTDSDELGGQKLTDLKVNTILKQNKGDTTQRFNSDLGNTVVFENYSNKQIQNARLLGSASEASLGVNPSSGTPFALQNLIVQQGEGIHTYRQGKIATFFADVLYPKLIIPYLLEELNKGQTFSEEFTLDELTDIAESISIKQSNDKIKDLILSGKTVSPEDQVLMRDVFKQQFQKGGTRRFMETLKDELKDAPIKVKINIAGKQKYLAQEADKLSKLVSMVISNPQAFATIPGLAKPINQLIESAGMNPIDFKQVIGGVQQAPNIKTESIKSPIDPSQLKEPINQ